MLKGESRPKENSRWWKKTPQSDRDDQLSGWDDYYLTLGKGEESREKAFNKIKIKTEWARCRRKGFAEPADNDQWLEKFATRAEKDEALGWANEGWAPSTKQTKSSVLEYNAGLNAGKAAARLAIARGDYSQRITASQGRYNNKKTTNSYEQGWEYGYTLLIKEALVEQKDEKVTKSNTEKPRSSIDSKSKSRSESESESESEAEESGMSTDSDAEPAPKSVVMKKKNKSAEKEEKPANSSKDEKVSGEKSAQEPSKSNPNKRKRDAGTAPSLTATQAAPSPIGAGFSPAEQKPKSGNAPAKTPVRHIPKKKSSEKTAQEKLLKPQQKEPSAKKQRTEESASGGSASAPQLQSKKSCQTTFRSGSQYSCSGSLSSSPACIKYWCGIGFRLKRAVFLASTWDKNSISKE